MHKASTDWAVSFSDHAAVEVGLIIKEIEQIGQSKITRLDPSLLNCADTKGKIEAAFVEMFGRMDPNWNPHLKLEYAKMCIRTVAEQAQADRKKKELSEEEEISGELNLAIAAIQDPELRPEHLEGLIEYAEDLRNKKAKLIEEKGKRLAEKLGTKWYNEGEKSTKYFLRLLNRANPDSFHSLINDLGIEVTSQSKIEEEVVKFYKDLYEQYDRSNIEEINPNDDFFRHINPVSAADDLGVSAELSLEELGRTLAACQDSSPGPDGIPYSFYKSLWKWVGPLIVEAWKHSVTTGNLCPSHKVSFLKLIPKVGKDIKKLTNWRPITLSNCDHKLITKTYANRMSLAVSQRIEARQTAYIKGRLINDNVRALLGSIKVTNLEENLNGLLVSLDAKKAFDSVEHSYIEKCLIKFGLSSFVPIFKILYSELRSDIIINRKIVTGYRILRGVKQGDALSCILFIICMEPMLRNIEENPAIEALASVTLEGALPKTYAYADDVNAIINNTQNGLEEIFNEYGKLTRVLGLELNADKTEIMHLHNRNQNVDHAQLSYDVSYLGKRYQIQTREQIKVNGVLL